MGVAFQTLSAAEIQAAVIPAAVRIRPIFSWNIAENTWKDKVNTWTIDDNAGYHLGGGLRNVTTPVINDAVALGNLYVPESADYTAYFTVATNNAFGKAHIFLNGIDKESIDLYSAGTVYSTALSVSLGTLAVGNYTIYLKAASKNASSSGYGLAIESLSIAKTP